MGDCRGHHRDAGLDVSIYLSKSDSYEDNKVIRQQLYIYLSVKIQLHMPMSGSKAHEVTLHRMTVFTQSLKSPHMNVHSSDVDNVSFITVTLRCQSVLFTGIYAECETQTKWISCKHNMDTMDILLLSIGKKCIDYWCHSSLIQL